jgi:hypothetical protein
LAYHEEVKRRHALVACLVPLVAACEFIFTGDDLVGPGPDASSGDAPVPDVADDGYHPCLDKTNDPFNCGTCGKTCLGGQCSSAKCQPGTFIEGETGVYGVAVNATHVYWTTTSGKVARRPVLGGDTEVLATGEAEPGYIAVSATHVWWTTRSGGAVRRKPIGGGAAETILGTATRPNGIALNGISNVYFTEQTDDGGVFTLVDGGEFRVVGGLSYPGDVSETSIANTFVVANEDAGSLGGTGFGGQFVATVHFPDPAGIVVTDNVWYFTSPSSGEVVRVQVQPSIGTPEILVPSLDTPTGIALSPDLSTLYWAETGRGRITRLVF